MLTRCIHTPSVTVTVWLLFLSETLYRDLLLSYMSNNEGGSELES
jgi:hypothetical protein